MELIDKNALIQDLRAYADDKGPRCGHYELANGILKAVGRVEQAPTVDAVPVVHGEWVYHTDNFVPQRRCSMCGHEFPIIASEFGDKTPMNYCSNCGARMGQKGGG